MGSIGSRLGGRTIRHLDKGDLRKAEGGGGSSDAARRYSLYDADPDNVPLTEFPTLERLRRWQRRLAAAAAKQLAMEEAASGGATLGATATRSTASASATTTANAGHTFATFEDGSAAASASDRVPPAAPLTLLPPPPPRPPRSVASSTDYQHPLPGRRWQLQSSSLQSVAVALDDELMLAPLGDVARRLTGDLEPERDKVDRVYKLVLAAAAMPLPSSEREDNGGDEQSGEDEGSSGSMAKQVGVDGTMATYVRRAAVDRHALLQMFRELARHAGVRSELVRGHAKGSTYWKTLDERSSEPNHNWLAVHVDGDWQLIDLLWCIQMRSDFYYLAEPAVFALGHLPVDERWQLLHRPVTRDEFFAMACVQASFVEHGLRVIEPLACRVVCCQRGSDDAVTLRFGYERSVGSGGARSKEFGVAVRLVKSNAKLASAAGLHLERCVLVEKYDGVATYTLHPPSPGLYRLEILCRDAGAPGFSPVCAYAIMAGERARGSVARPLPRNDRHHWGPTDEGAAAGLRALSHRRGVVLVERGGAAELRFAAANAVAGAGGAPVLRCELERAPASGSGGDDLSRFVIDRYDFDEAIVDVLLPDVGYYVLSVYVEGHLPDDGAGGGQAATRRRPSPVPVLACRYLLDCIKAHRGKIAFPYEERLGAQPLRRALNDAMARKWAPDLRSALNLVSRSKYSAAVATEAAAAKKMLDQLDRIESIKKDMMQANRSIVSEVRNYSKPPRVIHDIFNAALLLVGEPEVPYSQWQEIQKRCSNAGKSGLSKRVQELRILAVEPALAARSREILEAYDVESVKRASSSAFLFYVWATDVCKEVLLDLGNSVKPASVGQQKDISSRLQQQQFAAARRRSSG